METRPSERAAKLVARWEGFSPRAYRDAVGIPTIGYGSIRYSDMPGSPSVRMGDTITEERAEALLLKDLHEFWERVAGEIRVPLKQNQVDALSSFIYNVGTGAFLRSTLLRKLNAGDYQGASAQFPRWNRAGGRVLRGLSNRRKAERDMFDQ